MATAAQRRKEIQNKRRQQTIQNGDQQGIQNSASETRKTKWHKRRQMVASTRATFQMPPDKHTMVTKKSKMATTAQDGKRHLTDVCPDMDVATKK